MKFISLFLALLPLVQVSAVDYHVTNTYYPATANFKHICKSKYGQHADVVDFSAFKAMVYVRLDALMAQIDIPQSRNKNHYFVTFNNEQHYAGSNHESYFIEYTGTPVPAFFESFEEHHGVALSATNKMGQILCTTDDFFERKLEHQPEEKKEEESTLTRRLKSSWNDLW